METYLIWIFTIIIGMLIVLPYFRKYRKTFAEAQMRKDEAVRLGAHKAIAQHPQIDPFICIGCGACVSACLEGDVLGIVSGKATIINGLKCVGHGKCAEACPVEGIEVGLGDAQNRSDIPILNKNFESSIPGLFIAGELGGLALIKNAVNQGQRVVGHISQSNNKSTQNDVFDVIIIGAGPAGLSAALAAKQHALTYLLIDQQKAGGTILQYPRKKLVMTKPVEIPLYGTLNKPEYSKEELLAIWEEALKRFNINIKSGEKLQEVKQKNHIFEVCSLNKTYLAANVILALGRRGTPRKLNIPGEDKPKVLFKLIDAESYQNEHILVVGGGDSALEAAMGLARQPGNIVTISYRKEKFFRIKKRNEERIADLLKNDKIRIIFNSQLIEIQEKAVFIESTEEQTQIENDFTFIFAGGEPPFALLNKIGVRFGSE